MGSVTKFQGKYRNTSLDILKGIAAIFVVFIHVKFSGNAGEYIAKLGSFAVPVFFMVSGYFSFQASKEKIFRSIMHIIQLIGVAYGLNLTRIFVSQQFSLSQTLLYLRETVFTVKHLIAWLLINTTYISGVAWFLWALLYCYIFCYLFYRLFKSSSVYLIAVGGFLGGIMAQIGLPALGYSAFGINNAWLCGLPYFLTGTFMRQRQNDLCESIKLIWCICSAILGFLLITLGYICKNGLWYIGDILLVISLFIICIKYPNIKCKPLQIIGNQLAFFVYIMHPIFMHLYNYVLNENDVLRPLIVLGTTIVAGLIFDLLKQTGIRVVRGNIHGRKKSRK